MTDSILYCGDTDLNGAAAYLAGLMASCNLPFDYVPSHLPILPSVIEKPRSLLILSDYPAAQFSPTCQELALRQIERGCGLLMIGGWESFHGFGGNWNETLLGSALPVMISSIDDRVNFDQSAWLIPEVEHSITANLPWYSHPPAIGGMNRVRPKLDSTVLLNAQTFSVTSAGPASKERSHALSFEFHESLPALVVGQFGKGRTASFLSDVAPHWVGGFVDWGIPRVCAQAANANAIEVGSDYARFWQQLIEWLR